MPNGFKIASAWVSIEPDMTGFSDKLRGAIAEEKDTLKIPAALDDTRLHENLVKTRKEIEDQPAAKIPAEVDKEKVDKSAKESGASGGGLLAAGMGSAIVAGGPLIAGAMAGAAVLGLIALGTALAKGDPSIQAAWSKLAGDAQHQAIAYGQAFSEPITTALGSLDQFMQGQGPLLGRMFTAAAQGVPILTNGIELLVGYALPGLANMVEHDTAILNGLNAVLSGLGSGVATISNDIAGSSGVVGADLSSMGNIVHTVSSAIGSFIQITSGLAEGVLPALNGILGTVAGTLAAVESAVGPILPALGGIALPALGAYLAFTKLQGAASALEATMLKTDWLSGLAGLARFIPGVGAAVVGLSAVTGILAQSHEDAARAANDQASSSQGLDKAMNGLTNATQAQVDALVMSNAAGQDFFKTIGVNLPQVLQAAGVSQTEFTTAIEQGGPALASVESRLDGYVSGLQNVYSHGGNVTDQQNLMADGASALSGQLHNLNNAFSNSTAATREQYLTQMQLLGVTPQSSGDVQVLAGYVQGLGDKSLTASQQLQDLQGAIHLLATGGTQTADDAIEGAAKAVDGLATSMAKAKGPLFDASGGLDLFSQKGQDARDAIKTIVDQGAAYVAALQQSGDSTQQITDKTQTFVAEMAGPLAKALGISKQQAENLIAQYGLIPSQVATTITTPGAVIAFQNIEQVQAAVRRLPPNTPVTVTGLTGQAEAALNGLGYHVTHMPNGTVTVTGFADMSPAQASINNFIRANNGRQIAMGINANTMRNAVGRIVQFADGGMTATPTMGLTPMAPIAQVVPPNTWRVVGDRSDTDEAYIPLDGSTRSRAILGEANRRMGSDGAAATVNHWNITTQDPYQAAQLVAAQQAWNNMIGAH